MEVVAQDHWATRYHWPTVTQAQKSPKSIEDRIVYLAKHHKRHPIRDRRTLELGSFLHALRKKHSRDYPFCNTFYQFAEEANLDPAAYYFFEFGLLRPEEVTRKFLERIAAVYGLDYDGLVNLSQTMKWIRKPFSEPMGAAKILHDLDQELLERAL